MYTFPTLNSHLYANSIECLIKFQKIFTTHFFTTSSNQSGIDFEIKKKKLISQSIKLNTIEFSQTIKKNSFDLIQCDLPNSVWISDEINQLMTICRLLRA